MSSKISEGNRVNKYVERVCSVCSKWLNNPLRAYARSIAVIPTLGMRTRGYRSLISLHQRSVCTSFWCSDEELREGDRKLHPQGRLLFSWFTLRPSHPEGLFLALPRSCSMTGAESRMRHHYPACKLGTKDSAGDVCCSPFF